MNTQEQDTQAESPEQGKLSAIFQRHAPVGAIIRGLMHQAMCGSIMMTGHVLATPVPAVGAIMSHPATNLALMGMAAWCWRMGDKGWMQTRGKLARTWEKFAARGAIAVAGTGMMLMHTPGMGMHDHHHDHMHGHADIDTPTPQAQAWMNSLKPAERQKIEKNAASTRMSVGEYVNSLCGLPLVPYTPPATQKATR